ncbi:MAG: DUF4349 domain-containing protein [Actinobacteria bacterium]|jgi:hypothetical protein|nr:DUF4349 domain-containing protein [Actinomycetota bacterium]
MKIQRISKRFLLYFILLTAVIALALTSCGIFGQSAESVDGGYFEETKAASLEEAPAMEMAEGDFAAEEESVYRDDAQFSDTANTTDRKVIKTAYLELEVGEGKFEKALFDLTRLADNNGGFVSNTQSYSDADGKLTSGSITIRIPHDKYNSALDLIKDMGTVESITVSGQDVTQEYTDLESRLRNLNAQEEILLDLMSQSNDVGDSIEVQRELSYVMEQIEVIKGRMNYLDNMVSLSTIDVYMHEPEPITTSTGWGFLEALKKGLRGAVTVFNGILIFLIAASPILAIIAIILVVIWLIIRSRRRRRARVEKK